MSPEDVRALLTDEWRTTGEIARGIPSDRRTQAGHVQAVRRALDSGYRFGLVERRETRRGGIRMWEWRRAQ